MCPFKNQNNTVNKMSLLILYYLFILYCLLNISAFKLNNGDRRVFYKTVFGELFIVTPFPYISYLEIKNQNKKHIIV